MAKNIKTKTSSSVPHKNEFADSIHCIARRFSVAKVFDDFLTLSIAACTQNPLTKMSHYEEEYLETIAPYKDLEERHEFPKAFASLITEMEERIGTEYRQDVLGEFFEQNISNGKNGQFFTPWHICQLMDSLVNSNTQTQQDKPLKILDPCCGSGRMLLAAHENNGVGHEYYGIDIDQTCVKMTALNLFLNGMWNSEVMCANALVPDDFVFSYRISLLPFGIFKITEKENSMLWHMNRNSFSAMKEINLGQKAIVKVENPFTDPPKGSSAQLDLFS